MKTQGVTVELAKLERSRRKITSGQEEKEEKQIKAAARNKSVGYKK